MPILKAKKREETGKKLFDLRKGGFLPAIYYGLGKKSTPVTIELRDFQKVLKQAGETSTVTLETPEGTIETLIHDVQMDPVRNIPIHADFLAIDVNKVVNVEIPLEFIGTSEAVKGGGILVKVMHEIEVEALPKDLPQKITVDISILVNTDSVILVKDLKLPNGVKVTAKDDEIVASVAVAKEEKEEIEPADLTKIEVEKKGKKEEEGTAEEGAKEASK